MPMVHAVHIGDRRIAHRQFKFHDTRQIYTCNLGANIMTQVGQIRLIIPFGWDHNQIGAGNRLFRLPRDVIGITRPNTDQQKFDHPSASSYWASGP